MKISNPEAVARVLDILNDEPDLEPDMNLISHIVAGYPAPISLYKDIVYVLWLYGEYPDDFDHLMEEL